MTDKEQEVFNRLTQAIAERIQVRLRYTEEGDNRRRSTKLSPYQLAVHEGHWTVLGRSTWHRGVIRLQLEDIQSLVPTQDPYDVPLEYLQEGSTGNAFLPPPATSLGEIPPVPERNEPADEDAGEEEDENEEEN
jgi:predicted DNA-binding transcriptional regulator YafY